MFQSEWNLNSFLTLKKAKLKYEHILYTKIPLKVLKHAKHILYVLCLHMYGRTV